MCLRCSYSRLTVYSPWRLSRRSERATRTAAPASAGRLCGGYSVLQRYIFCSLPVTRHLSPIPLARRNRTRSWCWSGSSCWGWSGCNARRSSRAGSWRGRCRRCRRCTRRSRRCWRCCWARYRSRCSARAMVESHVRAERAVLGARRRDVERADVAVYGGPGIH
jgi:hypothetical protein